MADMDAFERSVAKGLLRLADDVAGTVDAAAVAHRVAREHPRRSPGTVALGPVAVPRLAWLLLVAGMLFALVVGSFAAGGWWRELAVVVEPSPTATPAPTTIADPADILATTKAKPLPARATCPPGSTPDVPGSVDQDRPTGGEMAFDRHAGKIILVAADPLDPQGRASQTWTYDVCTNTWQLMRPAGGSPPGSWWPFFEPGKGRLIYDADSDRTLAFTDDHIWSYDLAADRWTALRDFAWQESVLYDQSSMTFQSSTTFGTFFYHDPSGLVVVYEASGDMSAYDVDTNTLSTVRQRPDPALPAGSGLPQGRIAFGYDPGHDLVMAVVIPSSTSVDSAVVGSTSEQGETWTFNPGNGTWRKEILPAARDLIVCGHMWKASTDCFSTNGRAVFDEASGLTVFFNRTGWTGSNRIDAYDASQGAWRTLRGPAEVSPGTPNNCQSVPPVYDPLNRRIVCLAVSDVSAEYWGGGVVGMWAFSSATGESR
ncbi:MAG: hypothetical protein H6Q36_313, partial [Chloroflexi bacterium]|nr:hypothetical protein [Chloroflexota bacterium]